MTLTLREEVLKNSGLLTEEILEEGFLKKALIIATTIAMIAGVTIGGIKAGKSINQYNSVKNVPVAVRYEKADTETNKDIQNKEYYIGLGNYEDAYSSKYAKLQFVDSIKSEYNERNEQAILHIYIDNSDERNEKAKYYSDDSAIKNEITDALEEYIGNLNKNYSKIENTINKLKGKEIFNKTPLKVVVHTVKSFSGTKYYISREIQNLTGTDSIEYKVDYKPSKK